VSLELLTSYLTNRQQYTVINRIKSTSQHVKCGVPQESTVGPFLFLVYINDLPLASNLKTRLFADDANLTLSHKSSVMLEVNVNHELTKIDVWMKANRLSINYNITEFLVITNRKIGRKQLKIKIGDHEITQKTEARYLGILIDDKINWKPQNQQQSSKIAKGTWALSKPKKYVNLQTVKRAYYALVYPHLQYCAAT